MNVAILTFIRRKFNFDVCDELRGRESKLKTNVTFKLFIMRIFTPHLKIFLFIMQSTLIMTCITSVLNSKMKREFADE